MVVFFVIIANMKLTKLFTEFFESERTGGIILICCTFVSLLIANSALGTGYNAFWHHEIAGHSIVHWINDLLMTFFFLLVGLEIEREIYIGELKEFRKASLPIFGAIGGMAIPALVYIGINISSDNMNGFGIPMATDIAFAIGILSLLGNRVPASLKIFLTALAIIDDLGAIIVIAIFYSQSVSLLYLGAALTLFMIMIIMNRMKVMRLYLYLIPGILLWYCMLQSGIHATIAGVLIAFAIPFREGDNHSPSYKLQHFLHKPVAFFVLPIFALANTAIVLNTQLFSGLQSTHALGIAFGLIFGKPIGILLMCYLAVKLKIAGLPEGVNWKQLAGVGLLAGIGFTMSIFISLLAFEDDQMINISKLAILISSIIAAVTGLWYLSRQMDKQISA